MRNSSRKKNHDPKINQEEVKENKEEN